MPNTLRPFAFLAALALLTACGSVAIPDADTTADGGVDAPTPDVPPDDVGSTDSSAPRDACPDGQSVCSGQCIDTASDPSHCGMCGQSCVITNALAACSGGNCDYSTIAQCTA